MLSTQGLTMTPIDTPILFAHALNGPLAGQPLDGADIETTLREEALGWVHLDAGHADAAGWIARSMPYLDETIPAALIHPATRARATRIGKGVLAVLRGLNLNPGKDPEDMVAIRIWIERERIVTLARQRVRALEDLSAEVRSGGGPATAGAFLARLAELLNARLEPLIGDLDVETDALESQVVGQPDQELRHRIVAMRLQVIELRRHTAPQREALQKLEDDQIAFLDDGDRRHLREAREKLVRLVENLDEMKDSLAVLREELSGQLSDRLNRHMYILSILSAIFLPLGFLTGLLGINVGGMPGAGNPMAFWYVCGGLLLVLVAQLIVLRRAGWL
ncbi:magnesium transporter, putative [Pseudooceanicola batsensis HTCC2597]|uniref:Magnesium transporter, putative n=1 Tax=Pseudooceanicola batsensis (strain ATCC BAA-863 / DSM 15984 / KCTC 12145 / HTCC2597) TaxID=252305 RepID=A3TU93_PSEBH|nr:zinc transporter ZntB [Pseudooceanicola batsensis]EAQ04089.1 magnesium transporter, putative [Pseudooceanicola batsensis HTCC2597]